LLAREFSTRVPDLDEGPLETICANHLAPAANVSFPPIVLKNSIFGEIGGIFRGTTQPAFLGEGFGLTGLPSLMCQLSVPHE
jgi:hypothetical protein